MSKLTRDYLEAMRVSFADEEQPVTLPFHIFTALRAMAVESIDQAEERGVNDSARVTAHARSDGPWRDADGFLMPGWRAFCAKDYAYSPTTGGVNCVACGASGYWKGVDPVEMTCLRDGLPCEGIRSVKEYVK